MNVANNMENVPLVYGTDNIAIISFPVFSANGTMIRCVQLATYLSQENAKFKYIYKRRMADSVWSDWEAIE